jgi:hypothetical protein
VKSAHDDVLDLFDFVWQRVRDRMRGLTDVEWVWCPTADDRVSLRWRLAHITDLLSEERNWSWLGADTGRSQRFAHADFGDGGTRWRR